MPRMLLALGLVVIAGLTIVSGLIHGELSDRWGPPSEMIAAAEKLRNLPERIGPWQLLSTEKLSDHVIEMLECAGYVNRNYVNPETGETVQVAVLLGPSGPMSSHTPEVCFSTRDFEVREERQPVKISSVAGQENVFWAMTFKANNLSADILRVYFAWSPGDQWKAVQVPRFSFADRSYLYKIQLAGNVPANADLAKEDCCRNFLEDFIPVLDQHLVRPTEN